MNPNNTQSILTKLHNYEHQVQTFTETDFSTTQVKVFKKYYNEMYLELIEYIKEHKNKSLSNKAKSLMLFSDIFGRTNQLLRLFSISTLGTIFGLVYLFYLQTSTWIILIATVLAIIITFVLIRSIQNETKTIAKTLKENGKIIHNIHTTISSQ